MMNLEEARREAKPDLPSQVKTPQVFDLSEDEKNLCKALMLLDECRDLIQVLDDEGIKYLLSADLLHEFKRIKKGVSKFLNDWDMSNPVQALEVLPQEGVEG